MFKFEKLDVWKVSLELYRKIAAATSERIRAFSLSDLAVAVGILPVPVGSWSSMT
ncbi:MAG: hypothetical protein HY803_02585 [candidate division NC10 bacterium]|nr:hypothetical protein [candidate division NC10 bacterium]